MDHVDECSCLGYAVSNFDLLSELWENTQIQISFKHYSFIVIIVCFFSYKLLIRSTFCMNLMWCMFEGVVVSQWTIFHFVFFLCEVEFLLSCSLRQCWSSDMLTYFIVMFSSLQKRLIDPESNKVQLHEQDFWRRNVYSSKVYVPDSVNKIY